MGQLGAMIVLFKISKNIKIPGIGNARTEK
jgi:hypothetical protein